MVKGGFGIYGFPVVLTAKLGCPHRKNKHIREYKKEDIANLKKMSKGAFRTVHWYRDSNFKMGDVDRLYVKWVENSCKGRASLVLIYEENKKVLGYVACNKQKNIGVIDLIAVSKDSKGKGVGKELVMAALNHFKEMGFNQIKVKTDIRNAAALNLYNKCGFKITWIGLNMNKLIR